MNRRIVPLVVPATALLVLLGSGCGGHASSGSGSSAVTLPAAGGTVAARGGEVQLTLPAGAVATDRPITVSTLSDPPQSSRVVGKALSFTRTTFSAPIRLRIAYDPSKVPSGSAAGDLSIYRLDGNVWTRQPSVVDPVGHTVTAIVSGFSDYGVLTPNPSPLVAEATLVSDTGAPVVALSWSAAGVYPGSDAPGDGIARWQVYRSDTATVPALVVDGARTGVVDSSLQDDSDFPDAYFASGRVGGAVCQYTSPMTNARTSPPRIAAGRAYVYSLDAVYKVLGLDLPGGTTGQTTGTTSTAGTTAGSAVGGTTGGTERACYFQTARPTSGQATPLNRPILGVRSGTATSMQFPFTVDGGGSPLVLECIVEFSDSPAFPSGGTVRTDPFSSDGTVVIDTTGALFDHPGASGGNLRTAPTIYYRVGVRNATDEPGPVKDALSGLRYIYSTAGTFTRTGAAP